MGRVEGELIGAGEEEGKGTEYSSNADKRRARKSVARRKGGGGQGGKTIASLCGHMGSSWEQNRRSRVPPLSLLPLLTPSPSSP